MKKRISSILITAALLAATGCTDETPVSSAYENTSAATSAPITTVTTTATAADTSAVTSAPITTTTTTATATATPAETSAPITTVTTAATAAATATAPYTPPAAEEAEPFSVRLEAEDAQLSGGLTVTDIGSCSGGRAVENFQSDRSTLTFIVDIPADGMYDLTLCSEGIGSYKENNLVLDGSVIGVFKSEKDVFSEYILPSVSISAGQHKLTVTKSWGWMKLDYIGIAQAKGIEDELYEITADLSNPKATQRTKELYDYLCDSYGKFVISGQVCDGGIFGREFTAIHDVTGEYPAMLGLDMMDYTPSRTALGAGTDAVERAMEFSEMGGIVTFCWHWNAPTEYLKSGNSDNGNPRWWGGFYTDNSTFDIDKVMNGEDSLGKMMLDRDIEEIANQLKRLENAGVPVLWRPLHEGSGGWFWWGAKGAEPYKKLWVYLYEQLTYEYGCNNLIWVFNGQNAEWYPGDEYVDIIGEDIYPGERVYSPQTARFTEAAAYSGENKIVALTENGCLFDIEQALMSNTMWSWFNTWGGEFAVKGSAYSEQYTEKCMLKKVYQSDYVITLDELDW